MAEGTGRGERLSIWFVVGILPLLYAHLFSLAEMRSIFAKQMQQGKAPAQMPQPAPADV